MLRDLGRLRPVARALVDRQQREQGLALVGGALQLAQRFLRAVQQAGLEEVQRQRVLRAVAVGAAQVAAREQVLVHAHGTLVFAAAAKQVAQREVQFRGVGVVLHRLDEGVDGLVLLLVQQEVQAAKVGLGRLPVLDAQLAQVQARGQPAQHEGDRQAPQDPAEVKVHACDESALAGVCAVHALVRAPRRGACFHQRGTMPSAPMARPERERGQHHQHQRRAPVRAEEEVHRRRPAGCSARKRTG